MKARFGWALALAMLLGSIGSAYAADMAVKAPPPVVPVDMWTGGYVGLNAGYGWGRDSIGSTAATGNNMYGLDASTGQILWSFASGGEVRAGAAIVGQKVYWGSGYPGGDNNKLYAFGL